jgi:hypothetical protein
MTSMFDYDDSVNMAFDAKIAGKNLVTAKHELLTKTGDFLFMAHSDRELAFRMQMVEEDIERTAHRRLANVSDSKAKLVRAVFDEWQLRHASCQFCKLAAVSTFDEDHNDAKKNSAPEYKPKRGPNDYHNHYEPREDDRCSKCGASGMHHCTGSRVDKDGFNEFKTPAQPHKMPDKSNPMKHNPFSKNYPDHYNK